MKMELILMKIELTPESAIQIQERLNSDISMVLDE